MKPETAFLLIVLSILLRKLQNIVYNALKYNSL